jgi:hypothetical protein
VALVPAAAQPGSLQRPTSVELTEKGLTRKEVAKVLGLTTNRHGWVEPGDCAAEFDRAIADCQDAAIATTRHSPPLRYPPSASR